MDGLNTENTGVVSVDGATTPEPGGMQNFTGFYKDGGVGLLPAAEALRNEFLIKRTSDFLGEKEPPKTEQAPQVEPVAAEAATQQQTAIPAEQVTVVSGFGGVSQVSEAEAEELWNNDRPVNNSPNGQEWNKVSSLEANIEEQIAKTAGEIGTQTIERENAVSGITLGQTNFVAPEIKEEAIEMSGGENGNNGIGTFSFGG